MLKLKDFFDINLNDIPVEHPINRVAYSTEDVKYKAKCIKAMHDLGMVVTIDKIGNICGTIPGKQTTLKSVICGSHTDSVDNGGQFDGPLGVFAGLKTAEDIVKSGKKNAVNYKAVIYACEESTRFGGKACIGSKFLRSDISDLDSITSRDGLTLTEIVATYKKELCVELEKLDCPPLIEVDKIIKSDEIITALEGHIEQADVLRENGNNIGICTSIVAPYRLKAQISDISTAAQFICKLNEHAREPENLAKYRATVPEFSIKNESSDLSGKKVVYLRSIGKNNHSGATPMEKRKDAVYGAAKLISLLDSNPDVEFLETSTPNWGTNQVNDCCDIKFAINANASQENLVKFVLAKQDAIKAANIYFEDIPDISEHDKSSGLFIDVRQQIGMNTKLSSDMIFETIKDIVHRTGCNCYMNITAKGEPFRTSPALVNSAASICEQNEIPYEILQSWAGHDLATLTSNPNAQTLLLFCDNSGGSHNPNETTTLDSINKLVFVESALAQQELERANKIYWPQEQDFER